MTRQLLHLQGPPRKRTVMALSTLAYLWLMRPTVLVGFGAVAACRTVFAGRYGKRDA